MTQQDLRAVATDWRVGLLFLVQHAPRDVYNEIKRRYGTSFPTYGQGREKFEDVQQKMFDFLARQAVASGDTFAFIAILSTAINYNQQADNWTKH